MAVAKVIEIVSASDKSWEHAVKEGFERATKTLKGITGLEIISFKAKVENDKIKEYRVHFHVTFVLES